MSQRRFGSTEGKKLSGTAFGRQQASREDCLG
jgi:hypothetical protein